MPTERAIQWAKENNSSWIPEVAPDECPIRVKYLTHEEALEAVKELCPPHNQGEGS